MAPRALPALALLAVLLAAAAAPSSAVDVTKLVAVLGGKDSTPPDLTGKGTSTVDISMVGEKVTSCNWTVTIQNLTDGSFPKGKNASGVVAMHIHAGNASTSGPIVFWLGTPLGGSPLNETLDFKGATPLGQAVYGAEVFNLTALAVLKDVAANPSMYYVNVHTLPNHPAGAVRGQLYSMNGTGMAPMPAMAPAPPMASPPMMKGALGLASWQSAAAAVFSAVAAALVL